MLINAVTYTFPLDWVDEVEGTLRQLREGSLREEGCLQFDVCRGTGDAAGTFVLYEKWRDQAALDAHSETEIFVRDFEGIRPLATSRVAVKGTPVE